MNFYKSIIWLSLVSFATICNANSLFISTSSVQIAKETLAQQRAIAGLVLNDDSINKEIAKVEKKSTIYVRDNINNTVTNRVTKVMWQDDNATAVIKKPWLIIENYKICDANYTNPMCLDTKGDTAVTYCKELVMGGHSDWQLPSQVELESLPNYGKTTAIEDTTFKNANAGSYWSSTTIKGYENFASIVPFYNGAINAANKNKRKNVRCIRNIK